MRFLDNLFHALRLLDDVEREGKQGAMPKDEDSTDKHLDKLGKTASSTYCQQWYTDKKGRRLRCAKKKGHWGKHG